MGMGATVSKSVGRIVSSKGTWCCDFFFFKDFMLAFFFLPVTVSCSVALAGLALSVTLLPLLPHWRDHECAGACVRDFGRFCLFATLFFKIAKK